MRIFHSSTTLVSLPLSLPMFYFISSLEREEDGVVLPTGCNVGAPGDMQQRALIAYNTA